MKDVIVTIFVGAVLLTIGACVCISVLIGKANRERKGDR